VAQVSAGKNLFGHSAKPHTGKDTVADQEACHARTNSANDAGNLGTRRERAGRPELIPILNDEDIWVIDAARDDIDDDLSIASYWIGQVAELESLRIPWHFADQRSHHFLLINRSTNSKLRFKVNVQWPSIRAERAGRSNEVNAFSTAALS